MAHEVNILLLMGGVSAERDVSLATGAACKKALDQLGYRYSCYDYQGDLAEFVVVLGSGYSKMLNCLHGTYGEDGRIQAIADLLQVPYSHSGVLASALAMDKAKSLEAFRHHDLPIPHGFCLDYAAVQNCNDWPILPPVVVKPVAEGSSIGVQIYGADTAFADVKKNILALAQRGAVLFEEFIAGRELAVSVAQDGDNLFALGVTELIVDEGFYDYQAKYSLAAGATHFCPADIPNTLQIRLCGIACKAHKVLGLRGVSRSDFRYNPENDHLVILETNTQPGMTETSLLPEQAALYGWDFPTLIAKILHSCAYD